MLGLAVSHAEKKVSSGGGSHGEKERGHVVQCTAY